MIAVSLADPVPCQLGPATFLPSGQLIGDCQEPSRPARMGKGLLRGEDPREGVQGQGQLTRGLQAFLDGLDLCQLHAQALPVHQRVQGLLHAPGRVAPQARATAGCIHPAGHPFAQGASGATAAARLSHQLLAAHGGAAARQLLFGAGRAVDGFVAQARPGPGGQQQQRGHEAQGQHDRARTGRRLAAGVARRQSPARLEGPDPEGAGTRGWPGWRTRMEPRKLASGPEGSEPGRGGAAPHPRPGPGGGRWGVQGAERLPGTSSPGLYTSPWPHPQRLPRGGGGGGGERRLLGGGGAVLSRRRRCRRYNI